MKKPQRLLVSSAHSVTAFSLTRKIFFLEQKMWRAQFFNERGKDVTAGMCLFFSTPGQMISICISLAALWSGGRRRCQDPEGVLAPFEVSLCGKLGHHWHLATAAPHE